MHVKQQAPAATPLPLPPPSEDVTLMSMLANLIREHVLEPDIQREIFKPLLKWFLWNLMPYVALFIGLNFFTTLAAVALVFLSVGRSKKMLA